jgi:hypothetical protein
VVVVVVCMCIVFKGILLAFLLFVNKQCYVGNAYTQVLNTRACAVGFLAYSFLQSFLH